MFFKPASDIILFGFLAVTAYNVPGKYCNRNRIELIKRANDILVH